jgi:hypothetical protein
MQMPVTLYPTRERLSKYIHTGLYHPPPHRLKFLPCFYVNFHQKKAYEEYNIKYLVILKKPIYFNADVQNSKSTNLHASIVPADPVLCICACASGSCTLYLCLHQLFLYLVLVPVPAVPLPCTCACIKCSFT